MINSLLYFAHGGSEAAISLTGPGGPNPTAGLWTHCQILSVSRRACPAGLSSQSTAAPGYDPDTYSSPSSSHAGPDRAARMVFCWWLLLAFIGCNNSVYSSCPSEALRPAEAPLMEPLLMAIEQVESGGRVHAVGDGGRAMGPLQIHKIMVDDINRILGRREFFYRDRLDRQRSFMMARIYLDHYGRRMTDFDKARLWNGGPRGHKKQSTVNYARKVMRVMESR